MGKPGGAATTGLDPFFSRIRFSGRPFGPAASAVPGDTRPAFGQDDVPACDTPTIDAHVGLRPTVVLVAAARPRLEIHDYTGRLLKSLGRPPVVIATHWDVQSRPYGAPQDEALDEAARFVREAKAAAPRSRIIVPRHFQTIVVGAQTSKGARA